MPGNRRAWELYRTAASGAEWLIQLAVKEDSKKEKEKLLKKLILIHDFYMKREEDGRREK